MLSLNYFCYILFCCAVIPQTVLSKGELKVLEEYNWNEMLIGEWMVEFYAPWCPACRELEPLWKEFAGWSEDLGIKVASVDITTSPGLSGRFLISALPTIFHAKNGIFRPYRGARDKESFISFIEEKKWLTVEPLPSWQSPQSIPMTSIASFFRLSMFFRGVHTSLMEDYGFSTWGSYAMFGLLIVGVGAVLGIFVVLILDCLWPKTMIFFHRRSEPIVNNTYLTHESDDDDEYEGEDVIKDDDIDEVYLRRRREDSPN